ncbi:SMI1/KNR4 family protein [Pedobacter frigidisoli]|uniref:SMI1/KNR4 family protein n=1 Tax=Pedobacter frigidisoli TaxID=2530455 RepID=UPI00292D69B6|nr:SMI1/KNR4 family protein [Pedobacter frigidisoli]
MTDRIDQFFKAYCRIGMRSVYTDSVPKEMIGSELDKEGWYEWKLIPGTLTSDNYKKVETKFKVKFPENFIQWHKRYFFADCDCSTIRLPYSLPTKPLEQVIDNLNWDVAEQLILLGLIPFADDGNDAGPLVFDTRNANNKEDFPIRVYDHEYGGDLDGLNEIVFSSFEKMLECLTHFLTETKTRKSFEVIPGFYTIDPKGAGSTGKSYWASWTQMEKANFEQFGY